MKCPGYKRAESEAHKLLESLGYTHKTYCRPFEIADALNVPVKLVTNSLH